MTGKVERYLPADVEIDRSQCVDVNSGIRQKAALALRVAVVVGAVLVAIAAAKTKVALTFLAVSFTLLCALVEVESRPASRAVKIQQVKEGALGQTFRPSPRAGDVEDQGEKSFRPSLVLDPRSPPPRTGFTPSPRFFPPGKTPVSGASGARPTPSPLLTPQQVGIEPQGEETPFMVQGGALAVPPLRLNKASPLSQPHLLSPPSAARTGKKLAAHVSSARGTLLPTLPVTERVLD